MEHRLECESRGLFNFVIKQGCMSNSQHGERWWCIIFTVYHNIIGFLICTWQNCGQNSTLRYIAGSQFYNGNVHFVGIFAPTGYELTH